MKKKSKIKLIKVSVCVIGIKKGLKFINTLNILTK